MTIETDIVNRRIVFKEPVGEKIIDKRGDEVQAYLTLSVSHDKERKGYVVFLDREARGPMFVTSIIDFGSGAPDVVNQFRYRVPSSGARYSLKTLNRIFGDVMIDWNDQFDEYRTDAREWARKVLELS